MAIGEKFREARKKKDLSLASVSDKIKVHPRILAAIEEEKFSEVPNPIYLKGFLKKYAQFLGLNSEEVIAEYLKISPEKPKQELTLPRPEVPRRPLGPKEIIFPLVLVIVIILVALAVNSLKLPGSPPAPTAPAPVTAKASRETAPSVQLKVEAIGDCWVRAQADGKTIFERVLTKGESASWKAKEEIVLRVGRAERLRFELNGTPRGAPGKGTINIQITKEGMKVID